MARRNARDSNPECGRFRRLTRQVTLLENDLQHELDFALIIGCSCCDLPHTLGRRLGKWTQIRRCTGKADAAWGTEVRMVEEVEHLGSELDHTSLSEEA